MADLRDFILERIEAYDSTIDTTSATFNDEFLDPLLERLGEDLPRSNPQAIINARLDETFPEVEHTVWADLFGKAAGMVFEVLNFELASARNRRRLDDPRLLSQTDLADQRDVYFVDPSEGSYSQGVFRVSYPSPRAVSFDPADLITVPGVDGGPVRIYRPDGPQTILARDMRNQLDGSLYYVDVRVIATAADPTYDLDPGEALGASGIPGAVKVTNPRALRGGQARDDAQTLEARIRTAVRFRGAAQKSGLDVILPELGVTDFHVVKGGDPLMVRDIIYGPSSISGIPGGFTLPAENVDVGAFIHIGIAFDVWIAPQTSQVLSAYRITNLLDEGVETLVGADGTLVFTKGVTAPDNFYTLTTIGSRFLEVVGTEELEAPLTGSLRPVEVGDLVHFEGMFTAVPGSRNVLRVEVVVDGTELILKALDTSFDPNGVLLPGEQVTIPGSRYRVLRNISAFTQTSTAFSHPIFAAPLTDPRAIDALGAEVFVDGNPALTKPGSTRSETIDGNLVARISNVIDDVGSFPSVVVERVELLDPISGQPSGDFIYPRRYLFAEFLDIKSGEAADKAVLLRVHLLGPQASALGPTLVTDANEIHQMFPIFWFHSSVTAVSDGGDPETDVLELDAGDDFTELTYASGSKVISGRFPRAGDWVQFIPDGLSTNEAFYFPIVSVDTTVDRIVISAPDIPTGTTGDLYIYQGASRATLLSEGRGPEGTYSFDVWLRESDAVGYTPPDPPLAGTQADFAEEEMLTQGFELVSALPGQQFSLEERVTLTLQGTHVADGQEIQGRSVLVHFFPGDKLTQVQNRITDDDNEPITNTGLVKAYAPSFVVLSFTYDAEDLTAEQAADAVLDEFIQADTDNRVELSDFIGALERAGADFIVSGRMFVMRQNPDRQWTSFATRGSVAAFDVGDFVLHAVTARRLIRDNRDVNDPDAILEEYTLRPGGFDAD